MYKYDSSIQIFKTFFSVCNCRNVATFYDDDFYDYEERSSLYNSPYFGMFAFNFSYIYCFLCKKETILTGCKTDYKVYISNSSSNASNYFKIVMYDQW